MGFPQDVKNVGFGTPHTWNLLILQVFGQGRGLGNAAEDSLFPPVDSLIPAPHLGVGLVFFSLCKNPVPATILLLF